MVKYRANQHHKLAFQAAFFCDFQKLRRFAAQKFLELLRQLARENDLAFGKNLVQLAQQFFNTIRRFVENQSAGNGLERFQLISPLAGFVRQKTDEMEFIRRQAARRERGYERARTRHGLDSKTGGDGGFDDALARIADAGTAGIRDQRDFLAAPETVNDFLAALGLVKLEITQKRSGDSEMLEQLPGAARVLGGDHVALAQDAQRAERDVLQVANRRGDEVKRAGSERRKRIFCGG